MGQGENRIIDGDFTILIEVTSGDAAWFRSVFLKKVDQSLNIPPIQFATGIHISADQCQGDRSGFRP